MMPTRVVPWMRVGALGLLSMMGACHSVSTVEPCRADGCCGEVCDGELAAHEVVGILDSGFDLV